MNGTPVFSVNVRELLRQPGAHKHVLLREPLEDVATPVAAVRSDVPSVVDAELEHVVEGVLVRGQVTAETVLHCVRCLAEVDQTLRVDVEELFALRPERAEEPGYAVLPDDTLPLDTMVRDAIVLALPVAPLCRPECAGLCSVCGKDLNQGTCDHQETPADPRWLPLLELLERNGQSQPQED